MAGMQRMGAQGDRERDKIRGENLRGTVEKVGAIVTAAVGRSLTLSVKMEPPRCTY